mgnify:FL=1
MNIFVRYTPGITAQFWHLLYYLSTEAYSVYNFGIKLDSMSSLAIYLMFTKTENKFNIVAFLKICYRGFPPNKMKSNYETIFCRTTEPKEIYFCFSSSFSVDLVFWTSGVLSRQSSKMRPEMVLRRKGETNLSKTCKKPS